MNHKTDIRADFIKQCEVVGISSWELLQVKLGLFNGLTVSQVGLYADKKYNTQQMEQIRITLEDNIPLPLNLNPEFSAGKLKEYRLTYRSEEEKRKQDIELIEKIKDLEQKIEVAYMAILHELKEKTSISMDLIKKQEEQPIPEQSNVLKKLKKRFQKRAKEVNIMDIVTVTEYSLEQMQEITTGYYNGLTIDEIQKYAKPEIESIKMREIRKLLEAVSNKGEKISTEMEMENEEKSFLVASNDGETILSDMADYEPDEDMEFEMNEEDE
jgi:hypothetical protein